MNDAGVWRHHLEIVKCALAPTQESIAFLVALELDPVVQVQRIGSAIVVNLYRVVDHQFGRRQRVDFGRRVAELLHRVAHCRQVDNRRHTGEVLQHDSRRGESDFLIGLGAGAPASDRSNILGGNVLAIFMTQQVLEQDFQREG